MLLTMNKTCLAIYSNWLDFTKLGVLSYNKLPSPQCYFCQCIYHSNINETRTSLLKIFSLLLFLGVLIVLLSVQADLPNEILFFIHGYFLTVNFLFLRLMFLWSLASVEYEVFNIKPFKVCFLLTLKKV